MHKLEEYFQEKRPWRLTGPHDHLEVATEPAFIAIQRLYPETLPKRGTYVVDRGWENLLLSAPWAWLPPLRGLGDRRVDYTITAFFLRRPVVVDNDYFRERATDNGTQ